MQTTKCVSQLVAACALSLAALTASAARPDPTACGAVLPAAGSLCADDFLNLNGEIKLWSDPALGGFTNQQDQAGLLCKTDSAVLKVQAQKYDDALVNLADIDAKVQTLAGAAKPKLSRAAADRISAAARVTADCINRR